MKAIFDVTMSFVALLLLSPLLVIVSVVIVIDDYGSPIFKQNRVGLGGKVFCMYKFRSMRLNAAEMGPYFTQNNDPRITRVGRFIRRTSIDELPQLFNVILGDMSIVGPRPDVPIQENNYSKKQWQQRTSVKPGITGLAQASARSDATPEQRIQLDLDYVNKHNFLLDMKIIFMTIKQIVNKGGN